MGRGQGNLIGLVTTRSQSRFSEAERLVHTLDQWQLLQVLPLDDEGLNFNLINEMVHKGEAPQTGYQEMIDRGLVVLKRQPNTFSNFYCLTAKGREAKDSMPDPPGSLSPAEAYEILKELPDFNLEPEIEFSYYDESSSYDRERGYENGRDETLSAVKSWMSDVLARVDQ